MNIMEEKQRVPFYKKTWFIVLSLIIFFPLGLVLMWLFTDWSKRNKWIITAVVLLFAIIINPTEGDEELADTEDEEQVAAEETQNEESSEDTEEVADEKEVVDAEEDTSLEDSLAESRQSEPLTDEEKAEREKSATEYKKEQEEKEKKQEQVEAEEESIEDSEVEEQAEEDQIHEQEIEKTINESLGEENISELNITEYDGSFEVDVTFAASENFTENLTANGIKRDIVDTTLDLKEMDHYVSYLLLTATLPLTDNLGNESEGQVMSASFNGETIEELHEDNKIFLYDNLENAADGFSAHPQFR